MYLTKVRIISICLFAKGVFLDVDNLSSNVYAQTFSHFYSLHFQSFLTSCKFTHDKFLRPEDIPTQSLRHQDIIIVYQSHLIQQSFSLHTRLLDIMADYYNF